MSYKKVAVAVSGCEDDLILLKTSLNFIQPDIAVLVLIHISDGLNELYSGIYTASAEDVINSVNESQIEYLESLANKIQWPRKKVIVAQGPVSETLANIVQDENCDILICGHHSDFLNRLLPVYRGLVNKITADLLIINLQKQGC